MKLTNNATFPVIVFCQHPDHGRGDDVTVEPGQTEEVKGPYLGDMDGPCWLAVPGDLACHEESNSEAGFQVLAGEPAILKGGEIYVCIRHHEDEGGTLALGD